MNYFIDDAADFLNSPTGRELTAQIGATSLDDVLRVLNGKEFANSSQLKILNKLGGVGSGTGGAGARLARFAGGKTVNNLLRVVPGLSVATAALGAADVVAGNNSLGNKAMDTVAMGIGGVLGAAGGPVGAAAGASGGKMVSDGLQWLFGDKKTADQRKMEEMLALLGAGR